MPLDVKEIQCASSNFTTTTRIIAKLLLLSPLKHSTNKLIALLSYAISANSWTFAYSFAILKMSTSS